MLYLDINFFQVGVQCTNGHIIYLKYSIHNGDDYLNTWK